MSERLIPVFGRVLVTQSGVRTGMAPPAHQLSHAGAGSGGPGKARVPKVVKVKIGPSDRVPGLVPDALEVSGRHSGTR